MPWVLPGDRSDSPVTVTFGTIISPAGMVENRGEIDSVMTQPAIVVR